MIQAQMLGLPSTFVVISCEQIGQIIRTGSLPSRGWETGESLILTSSNSNSDIFGFFDFVKQLNVLILFKFFSLDQIDCGKYFDF